MIFLIGRIEQKKSSSILLPDYKIGEVLEDKDEIIVYSVEYGLTKKTLSDKTSMEDIDKLFINKKTKRESKIVSRKESGEKRTIKKDENSDDENDNNENDDKGDEADEDDNNDKNKKSEKNEKNWKKNDDKKVKSKSKEQNSSSSGEDNSQDIKI